MPPTFLMVEDACRKLVEASEGLSADQSSQPHHVLLLEGARGRTIHGQYLLYYKEQYV